MIIVLFAGYTLTSGCGPEITCPPSANHFGNPPSSIETRS